MLHSRTIVLSLAFAAGLLAAACIPGIPVDTQTGGNAPLIADLDMAGTPFVIGTGNSAQQVTVDLRAPNKGTGERGGVTGSFTAIGGPYCVIIDPANKAAGPSGASDAALDDGDSDLFVGRASDYDGTPGEKIGDFHADYVDTLGVAHQIDENICVQTDLNGLPGAHAGKGTPEFCTITTDVGVPYIVKAETLSVPPDCPRDATTGQCKAGFSPDVLKVALRVSEGSCASVGTINENTLTGDN